ncbi:MAG: hypothetical protein ACREFX_06975 [Opitutaceae bacterium]
MKSLLICPSIRPAVPVLADPAPLALAPVLGQTLLAVWIERLALLGVREVRIVAPDRPASIRKAVGDGSRWGLRIEVLAAGSEPTVGEAAARYRAAGERGWMDPPYDIALLDRLPGRPDLPLFTTYAAWFAAVLSWLPEAVTPARVRVCQPQPGVWIGRRAHIAASARLHAPCWIGDLAYVGPGAVVGPSVVLEDRSVVERGARVCASIVGPDTFVGRMTRVSDSLASGSMLTNWRSGSSLRVPDAFLLCSLARPRPAPQPALPAPAGTAAPSLLRAGASLAAWWGRFEGSSRSLKPPA